MLLYAQKIENVILVMFVNGEMELSEIGKVAEKFLSHIPKHFPNMNVDEFVVMPNHIHAIIVIENKRRDVACNVSTNPMSIISLKLVLCQQLYVHINQQLQNLLEIT